MSEGDDTHYQPWLRNADAQGTARADKAAEMPQAKPPVGIDLSRYVRDAHQDQERAEADYGDDYVRPLPVSTADESWGALAAKSSRKLATSFKNGWNAFANWTIALGEKADVPARVAAMKLDEKAEAAAEAVADVSKTAATKTAKLSRSAAAKTAEGAKQLSQKTAEGVAKLELGEKIGDVAEKAGETLKKGATSVVDATIAASETVVDMTKSGVETMVDATKSGVETVVDATKSGVETVSKAGADLTRKPPAPDASTIPSALEQLLAEEAAAEVPHATLFDPPATPAPPPVSTKPAPTLPLFAEVPETVPTQHNPKKVRPSYRELAIERTDTGAPESAAVTAGASAHPVAPETEHNASSADAATPSPLATKLGGWRDAARAKLAKTGENDVKASGVPSKMLSASAYALAGTLLIGATLWGISGNIPPRTLGQTIGEGSTPPLAAAGIDRADRAEIEAIVHDYILNHPEIIPQAMERYQAKEIAQRVSGLRTQIETPFSGAWTGAANGDVTLVEFSDFACGFCRRSVADIERLLKEDKKLKIVFRELPILSDESAVAAKTGLAAAKQGKYMAYYNAQFLSGPPTPDNIKAAAAKAGLDSEATQKAFLNGDLQAELDKNMNLARQLGFSGTPTWVVGDKVLQGAVGYDELKKAIAEARAGMN